MTPVRWLLVWTAVGLVGICGAVTGWRAPRPGIGRSLARLRRVEVVEGGSDPSVVSDAGYRLGTGLADLTAGRISVIPDAADLHLVHRSPERQGSILLLAALLGATIPMALVAASIRSGLAGPGLALVGLLSVPIGAVLGPVAAHADTVGRAAATRRDLRHQLSAYLDVVTMLLAANAGHEGALLDASEAGDGRLFVELRVRMRRAMTSGRSLVDALDATGRELGISELCQVAATASLSATEGAPVVRTLSASCATLRSTLASEHDADARLRTSRLTTPLVGMALIFMALVVYPALSGP